MRQIPLHHTLRRDLIKDVLIWSGYFLSVLAIIFFLTLDNLVNYMITEMAETRMRYQIAEFSKHMTQGDQTSITEESDALVQDGAITGIILVDASGLLAQIALRDGKPPSLNISSGMDAQQLREAVNAQSNLTLFEARIPGHPGSLVLILDKAPLLSAIYTSTAWTGLVLLIFLTISILVLHFSLRKHLIEPIDEVRHIMHDELSTEDKDALISHLPDEVAILAKCYEESNQAHLSMEKQFHQAQKMEAIGTLVGGIAHDFNNTLAGINGNLYLAKQAALAQPDVIERLERIEKLSLRSAETVKNLLTFAHKTRVEAMPLLLGPFIKEAIKLNRVSVPESVKLDYDVAEQDMVVNGDPSQLHQVLLNLINNAFHATEGLPEQKIMISVASYNADALFHQRHESSANAFARISVSDNGRGISESDLPHIFEPFYTTKEVGKGTGLGLAMVYGSITSQKGVIEVESTPAGTHMHIYLPLIDIVMTADDAVKNSPASGHGECILLADDEESLLTATCEVLESLGYQVYTAMDGQQAVDIYESHQDKIDLVLLDIVMPQMGGALAARKMKTMNPAVKLMFVTGYDDKTFSDEGDNKLLDDLVIHKPYAIEELSMLIRQQLDS
ncbi:response regulator [Mariprofundus sp. EBB-1]|uniref:hybrid sensor histidine kinase/response regulator n=1 Tax=Mariprofundus sp. EBB-1 TaxID=2650971 RepID=UPI000EF24DB1|nr:ATP-binding protein [Mariprofundus sp. EBB-1]RLL53645.1 response regulator [Mariprofundus sp. EBB-1]